MPVATSSGSDLQTLNLGQPLLRNSQEVRIAFCLLPLSRRPAQSAPCPFPHSGPPEKSTEGAALGSGGPILRRSRGWKGLVCLLLLRLAVSTYHTRRILARSSGSAQPSRRWNRTAFLHLPGRKKASLNSAFQRSQRRAYCCYGASLHV